MLCQRCSQKLAAIHVQQNINGKTTQIHLCQSCYKDIGGSPSGEFGWASLFGGIEGLTNGVGYSEVNKMPKCRNCGLTYEEFISNGRFGCANCYVDFSEKLEQMFKCLHGSSVHQGRLPESVVISNGSGMKISLENKIAVLKQSMAKAVKDEDYLLAATLRDEIIELDKQGGEGNDK